MLTSLVLWDIPYSKAADQASSPNHEPTRHSKHLSQQLLSLDRTLLDISNNFQIHIRNPSFLAFDLTEFWIHDQKGVTNNSDVMP